jgi:hypothetical protein
MTLNNRQRLMLLVSAVVAAKLVTHALGWELLSMNPLFSGIVVANVFLMGFLLSGVLSDYKESERLPGSMLTFPRHIAAGAPAMARVPRVWKPKRLAHGLLLIEASGLYHGGHVLTREQTTAG